MADQENETKRIEKLKELEKNLAKELDQSVRLSEPTDPRLDGSVQMNPTFELTKQKGQVTTTQILVDPSAPKVSPPTAAASVPSAEKKVEDISLQEVDDLLNQLDSGFQATLEDIKKEITQIEAPASLESLSIGADYLKEAESKNEPDVETEQIAIPEESELLEEPESGSIMAAKFTRAVLLMSKSTFFLPLHLSYAVFKQLLLVRSMPPRQVLLDMPNVLLPIVRNWLDLLVEFLRKVRSYSLVTYLKVLVLLLFAGATYYLVLDIISISRPTKEKDPFLSSFNDVADSVQILPEEDSGEDLESPSLHREYIVLVHKINANLKAPSPRHTPMVSMELFIEASNQECAVEIHEREMEVRDVISRLLEQTTFETLDSADGKNRLKIRLRAALNKILNRGRAKGIFFKSLQFHQ